MAPRGDTDPFPSHSSRHKTEIWKKNFIIHCNIPLNKNSIIFTLSTQKEEKNGEKTIFFLLQLHTKLTCQIFTTFFTNSNCKQNHI